MREILALVVVLAAAGSYVPLMQSFGWYQRWPILHLLALLAGTAMAVLAWRRRTSLRARVLSGGVVILAVAITGLFTWWTLSYSVYGETERGPAVGAVVADQLAGVELADWTGAMRPVWRPDDAATLLVFYRGHW